MKSRTTLKRGVEKYQEMRKRIKEEAEKARENKEKTRSSKQPGQS